MSRTALTSIVATSPHPKRWLRRLRVGAIAIIVTLLVVLMRDAGSIGVPALITAVALYLLLRSPLAPLRRELGGGAYARIDGGVAITAIHGERIVVAKDRVRRVQLEHGVLVIARKDGTALHLAAAEPVTLSAIADLLGFAPKLAWRVRTLSWFGRTAGFGRIVAQLALGLVGLILFVGVIALVRDLFIPLARPDLALPALLLAGLAVAFTLPLIGGDVRIGADGISFRKLLRRRFAAFERIANLEREVDGVTVILDDGQRVRLHAASPGAEVLVRELVAGARRQRSGAQTGTALESVLDRRGRDAASWRGALEQLLTNPGGYRVPTVARKDLVRVVEDGGAPPDRRVAAAIALRVAGTRKPRQRVLAAARASADEDLRAALEAAADGEVDEEAIARATRRRAV